MRIDRRVVFWVAALAVLLVLLFVFSSILLPFVAGAAIAYLLDPLADWFERQGFSPPRRDDDDPGSVHRRLRRADAAGRCRS